MIGISWRMCRVVSCRPKSNGLSSINGSPRIMTASMCASTSAYGEGWERFVCDKSDESTQKWIHYDRSPNCEIICIGYVASLVLWILYYVINLIVYFLIPPSHILTVIGNVGSVDFHCTQRAGSFLNSLSALSNEVNKPGFSQERWPGWIPWTHILTETQDLSTSLLLPHDLY